MKQAIFLCLLSLTLCLSKPTEPEGVHAAIKPVGDAKVETANESQPAAPIQASVAPAQASVAPAQTSVAPNQASVAPPQASVATPQTTATSNQTAVQPTQPGNTPSEHAENQKPNSIATSDSNKTTEKKDDTSSVKPKSTEGSNVVVPSTPSSTSTDVKPETNTKPEEKGSKSDALTPVPGTPKSSEASKTNEAKANVAPKDEDKHIVQARGFDGPSFIGGIILSLGLLAIGFMGFKYYKNQTERNYHTL